ncbi:DsbA family protein [Gordonia sp. (in: high G+C Gram-positive bacteria)]|uniref:DsbA family protein n=1 Tax=Gordonia sp. (in: high G+C Gram-positive bacteria) TaxID=84139 RepID=UPI0039E55F74
MTGSRKTLVIVAAVIAVFVALVVVARTTGHRGPTENSATTAVAKKPGELAVVRRDPTDPMGMGNPDAPVVLSQWTDLRCPYCAVFNREVLPKLIDEYVKPGKVRFEVTDVAFFGDQSEKAAIAARAAARQGKYFEFTKAVYAEAPEKGHPDLPRDRLVHFATKAGVPDLARFEKDLDDPALALTVRDATAAAQGLGVPSVPFFLVGTSALAGAQPVETFRAYLDEILNKAG